ncbi:MAG: hypothetical protein WA840_03805 [Caulobacteraceae bacterium]
MPKSTYLVILASTLIMLSAAPSRAEGTFKGFMNSGDKLSCTRWVAKRAERQAAAEEGWVFGFASGLNFGWDPRVGEEYRLSEEQLLGEVDAECKRVGVNGYLSDVVVNILHHHIEAAQQGAKGGRE